MLCEAEDTGCDVVGAGCEAVAFTVLSTAAFVVSAVFVAVVVFCVFCTGSVEFDRILTCTGPG